MVLLPGVLMTGQSMPAPLAREVVIVGAALSCVIVVLSEDGVEVELKMSMSTGPLSEIFESPTLLP